MPPTLFLTFNKESITHLRTLHLMNQILCSDKILLQMLQLLEITWIWIWPKWNNMLILISILIGLLFKLKHRKLLTHILMKKSQTMVALLRNDIHVLATTILSTTITIPLQELERKTSCNYSWLTTITLPIQLEDMSKLKQI